MSEEILHAYMWVGIDDLKPNTQPLCTDEANIPENLDMDEGVTLIDIIKSINCEECAKIVRLYHWRLEIK